MIEITFNSTGLQRKLGAAPQIIAAGVAEVTEGAGQVLANAMKAEVGAIAVTGSLSGPTASAITVWQEGGLGEVRTHAGIQSPTPAMLALNYGRRAGAPPPPSSTLIPWIMARGLASSPADAQRMAFVIARAIGRNGTVGKQFVRKTADGHSAEAKAYVKSHLPGVIKRLWGG